MHELILGGQKSGKSRCAEQRAAAWLAVPAPVPRSAVLIATGLAGDDEMRARIARHRRERAERIPGLATREVPLDPAGAIAECSTAQRLVIVDCLTMWLTNLLMPLTGAVPAAGAAPVGGASLTAVSGLAAAASGPAGTGCAAADPVQAGRRLCAALAAAPGPVVLVSNEIGLGISPMSSEVRRFVDALGSLHQSLAALCPQVTLLVAGIELALKREAP